MFLCQGAKGKETSSFECVHAKHFRFHFFYQLILSTCLLKKKKPGPIYLIY